MPIQPLPIANAYYDRQRFTQFGSQDCANHYQVPGLASKDQVALYPAMGRRHVTFLGDNQLVFQQEPRAIFRSIDFAYIFVGVQIYQIDQYYNTVVLSNTAYDNSTGPIWFSYLT